MDDSDDYFDDIAFTEKDFESIDAEATRCLSATQQTPIPPEARNTPPPAKRQKTTHTWNKPGNGTEPPGSTDEFEVMPEILVQGDGSYAFYGSRGRPSRGVSGRPGTSHPPVRPLSATSSVQSVQSVKPVHSNQPRPQSLSRRPSGGSGVITQRSFSPIPPQVHRTAVVPLSRRPSGAQPLHRVDSNQEKVIQALQTELTNLRAHVDELSKEKESAQKAMQEAKDARFTSLGEVSILRSTMDKREQQHTAEVVKLKSAKEAAEAKQAQIQRSMKEEMERFRTQMTFRQHELETSTYKTPWTNRTRKIERQPPISPMRVPSQIQQWNPSSSKLSHTPRKPRQQRPESPERIRTHGPPRKKPVTLPGFHNAFEPSSPVIAKGKGKQRETRLDDHNVVFGEEAPPSSPTPAPAPRLVRTMGLPGPSPEGTTLGPVFPVGDFQEVSTIDPDVEMLDSSKGDSLTVEEISEVEPVDWKIKVHDILFGHAIALPNKSKSFTLPLLMHLHIEKDTPASALSEHNVACDGLLKALRAPSDIVDEGVYISTIANSLVSLVGIFNVASSIPTLSCLLNLLHVLCSNVTLFATHLLTPSPPEHAQTVPTLLALLCDAIVQQLNPDKDYAEDELLPLAKGLLGLIDTLCCVATGDMVPSLGVIPRTDGVFSTLLSPEQPLWLLQHATKTISYLASHLILFKDFLAIPTGPPNEQENNRGLRAVPHIERMAQLLRNEQDTPDVLQLKSNILGFTTMMSIAHTDALLTLVQSQTLVPSIIIFLTDLSNAFWEESDDLLESPELVAKHAELICSMMLILHSILCGPFATRYAVSRFASLKKMQSFIGMADRCTVTFSRFSFADIPIWVEPAQREQLEQLTEMAKEMLELFYGPELEGIWASYQPDPDVVRRGPLEEEEDTLEHMEYE